MKKTLILTESELINVVNRIVESYNDEIYDEEDYVEAFLQYFRPWVRKNHGDEVGESPLSYLIKKHISEFAKDIGLDSDDVVNSWRSNISNASRVGKRIVSQGKHKLPSLRSQEKFTERFKKPFEFFLNELNIPDYIELNFFEDNPYNVRVEVIVDWLRLIKSKDEKAPNLNSIKTELEKRIKDFLGVEFGNPTHGQLKLNFGSPKYVGIDEWIKKDFNKEIKKKIKLLPNATRIIHAIKFVENGSSSIGGELQFSIKSYTGKHDLIKRIKDMLQSMGYNTNILKL